MTLKYYEHVKDYLHPHIHQFINHHRNGNIIDLPLYHLPLIAWIEAEQERKLSTTWIINASFQLTKVIGKKQRINTKEDIFTGQDIWQEPIADIYLKTKVASFSITHLRSTNIFLKRQSVTTFIVYKK